MALIVNGERVEDALIKEEAERLRPEYERVFKDQIAEEREAQLLDWSKENVLERILINQEVRRNGPQIPKEEIDAALAKLKEQYADPEKIYEDFDGKDDAKIKEGIELQMRVQRKLEGVCKDLLEPSKAAIREYYDRNKEQFTYGAV